MQRMPLAELEERPLEMPADLARVLLQPLVTDHVEDGESRPTLETGLPPVEEKKYPWPR